MQRNPEITFHFTGFALFRCRTTCLFAFVDFARLILLNRQGLFHYLTASLTLRAQGKRQEGKHEVAELTRRYCACASRRLLCFLIFSIGYLSVIAVSRQ